MNITISIDAIYFYMGILYKIRHVNLYFVVHVLGLFAGKIADMLSKYSYLQILNRFWSPSMRKRNENGKK